MAGRDGARKAREQEAQAGEEAPARSGPRPFWSGTLAFGLVSVPVHFFVGHRRARVALRMTDRDGTPLARRWYCPREERLLERDDLVRGYEIERDRFVVLEDEELEAIAPEKSSEIALRRFVPVHQLDPVRFERAWFLAPGGATNRPYRLLAEVMERAERAGVATFVLRGKEYLVALLASGGLLRAETLRFDEELRTPREVGLCVPRAEDETAVRRFRKAMNALGRRGFRREALQDHWSARVRALARRKLAAGEDVTRPSPAGREEVEEDEGAEVVDLMEVLARSLAGDEDRPRADVREGAETRKRGRGPGRKGGSAGGGGARRRRGESVREALAELSKRELYERARSRELRGRSRMSREQLIEALVEAS